MDHLSSSQINLYLQCALKYRYQYIDKLPRLFTSSALVFGSALHSALDWLHGERMKGNGDSLEALYRTFDADWFSQRVEADVRFKEGEQELELATMGKQFLTLYVREPRREILGSEVAFAVPLLDPATGETLPVDLEGFLDLVEADGTIVEFKTSAQALTQFDIDSRLQLTAYSYAFEILNRKPPQAIRVVNFVKARKPRIDVLETRRTHEDYRGFFLIAKEVLHAIGEQVFVPRPGFWCKECEYRATCPLWQRRNGNGKSEGRETPAPNLSMVPAHR